MMCILSTAHPYVADFTLTHCHSIIHFTHFMWGGTLHRRAWIRLYINTEWKLLHDSTGGPLNWEKTVSILTMNEFHMHQSWTRETTKRLCAAIKHVHPTMSSFSANNFIDEKSPRGVTTKDGRLKQLKSWERPLLGVLWNFLSANKIISDKHWTIISLQSRVWSYTMFVITS